MTDDEIVAELERQRQLLIEVATGGPAIDDVNDEYRKRRARLRAALGERRIEDPNPYSDLWGWWDWCSSRLPTYASRRGYVAELYDPLIDHFCGPKSRAEHEPTGWERVDRGLGKARREFDVASSEEDFQAVGLHCREVLISIGEIVFDPEVHLPGQPAPSATDVKRRLDAFFGTTLAGPSMEEARALAKAAVRFALAVQHKRTATAQDAALCVEATSAVTRLAAILAQGRKPEVEEGQIVDDLAF